MTIPAVGQFTAFATQTDITQITNRVDVINDTVSTASTGLKDRVTALEASDVTIKTDIGDLDTRVDAVELSINEAGTGLKARVDEIQSRPSSDGSIGFHSPNKKYVQGSLVRLTGTAESTLYIANADMDGTATAIPFVVGTTGQTWAALVPPVKEYPPVSFGDIKDSLQTADHNGWILMNGRAKSSLTTSQQAAATAAGIGSNLPDARNRFRIGAGGAHNRFDTGGNSFISRANLPNVNITGTTNNNNTGHTHTVDPPSTTTSNGTAHTHYVDLTTVAGTGNHEHKFTRMGTRNASGTDFTVGNGSTDIETSTTGTGAHGHSVRGDTGNGSAHTHTVDIGSFTSGSESASHTHNFEFNLNGNTTQLGYMPNYLAVNVFVYLGP